MKIYTHKTWECLRCGFKNEFREPTKEEAEKSKQVMEMNPYAKDVPKGLKDVWCDNCKAHNTLIEGKAATSSGGKFFYKKFTKQPKGCKQRGGGE